MIEPVIRRFLSYEHRKFAVIILTLTAGLVTLFPAVDEYTAAKEQFVSAKKALQEAKAEVSQLPMLTRNYVRGQEELRNNEQQAVDRKAAQTLRNELVELVRQNGCMLRSVRLSEPTTRAWLEEDQPVQGPNRLEPGNETPFELTTRQLSLSMTGPMTGIHRFLAALHGMKQSIHMKQVSMKRADLTEKEAILELELLLFDLSRKSES